ncbi:hypothetical protein ACWV95_03020 [Streptomyces albus]
MGDVLLDREHERLVVVAVAEMHVDRLLPAQFRGQKAVRAVDDAHGAAVDEDGRQCRLGVRQQTRVLVVESGQPG